MTTLQAGNLTFRQLELFDAAARAKTFSAGARTLGISQPTLSAAVAKLERQLNVALFDRSGRQMMLTSEGMRFALATADLLRIYRTSIANLRTSGAAARRVAFAVAPTLGATVAAEAVASFKACHDGVEVTLHDIGRREAIALLLDGVIDFAVMVDAPASVHTRHETIGSTHFVAAFAVGSPLETRDTVGWSDLADHPLILAGDLRQRGLLQSMWESDGVDLRPAYEVVELTTGIGFASQGLGYVLLPSVFVSQSVTPHVSWARLDCPQLVRPLHIVSLKDRPLDETASALVDALRAVVARLE